MSEPNVYLTSDMIFLEEMKAQYYYCAMQFNMLP